MLPLALKAAPLALERRDSKVAHESGRQYPVLHNGREAVTADELYDSLENLLDRLDDSKVRR